MVTVGVISADSEAFGSLDTNVIGVMVGVGVSVGDTFGVESISVRR